MVRSNKLFFPLFLVLRFFSFFSSEVINLLGVLLTRWQPLSLQLERVLGGLIKTGRNVQSALGCLVGI